MRTDAWHAAVALWKRAVLAHGIFSVQEITAWDTVIKNSCGIIPTFRAQFAR